MPVMMGACACSNKKLEGVVCKQVHTSIHICTTAIAKIGNLVQRSLDNTDTGII